MRRKVIAASLAACFAAVLCMGTWALFTAIGTATNVVTVGDVSIRLVEDFDELGAQGIVPGESIRKKVYVENDGSNPAWVRVRLDVAASSAGGEALETGPVGLRFSEQAGAGAWVDGGDGWLYLVQPLDGGMASPPLIDAVSLDGSAGKDYAGAKVTVSVRAQAVQSQNNDGSDGVLGALGWSDEEDWS